MMDKPSWSLAPNGATHMIRKTSEPHKGSYHFAFYDGKDFKISLFGFQCFHPDGYEIVETRK